MTLLQDGLIAFLSAVGVTTLVWIVAGAFFRAGRPAVPGLLLVLPLRGEALAMEADVRELRRLRGRLPGARIVLADCGLTRDARALAAYLADRDPGVALTDGAVIRLDENEHTKEEEHGRAWKSWSPVRERYIASFFKMPRTAIRSCAS